MSRYIFEVSHHKYLFRLSEGFKLKQCWPQVCYIKNCRFFHCPAGIFALSAQSSSLTSAFPSSLPMPLFSSGRLRRVIRQGTGQSFRCLARLMCPLDISSPFGVASGLVHFDRCIPPLLLPVLLLLGSDRGMAVVHGSDRPSQKSHHTQAFPVSWLGWAFSQLFTSYVIYMASISAPLLMFNLILLPGLPALVVAISVGFTKAKGYGTPS